jgi:hypothetical protein
MYHRTLKLYYYMLNGLHFVFPTHPPVLGVGIESFSFFIYSFLCFYFLDLLRYLLLRYDIDPVAVSPDTDDRLSASRNLIFSPLACLPALLCYDVVLIRSPERLEAEEKPMQQSAIVTATTPCGKSPLRAGNVLCRLLRPFPSRATKGTFIKDACWVSYTFDWP